MKNKSRRGFLGDVSRGMLMAGVGSCVLDQLGISPALADQGGDELTFGKLEPMVSLMQETPSDQLQRLLIKRLKTGDVNLRDVTAAAGLANARSFGGDDYVGFHALMAMVPAYEMSRELSGRRQPLPVLKVVYRSAEQIQKQGGRKNEVLSPVAPAKIPKDKQAGIVLRDAVRERDVRRAERIFAASFHDGSPAKTQAESAFNDLQYAIQDDTNVHRVVLAHRAWSLIGLVGIENAHTMLRQSVRQCMDLGRGNGTPIRQILPRLLDQYRLLERKLGKREAEDAWIERMSKTILESNRATAADAVAAALADGISSDDVGHALSLAANRMVLLDRNDRTHGASVGVHASDAALAWRSIARVTNHRNTVASLIVGAYHIADGGKHVIQWEHNQGKEPYPLAEHLETLTAKAPDKLIQVAEEAIRENDQGRAGAAIHRYGELGHPARPVFDLMLRYAISEDGRLHGEKYYRTVAEEFSSTRPAFRWRQLVALARVTASAYGFDGKDRPGHRAAGYEEACRLLKV
jgi:hypothetical protein